MTILEVQVDGGVRDVLEILFKIEHGKIREFSSKMGHGGTERTGKLQGGSDCAMTRFPDGRVGRVGRVGLPTPLSVP